MTRKKIAETNDYLRKEIDAKCKPSPKEKKQGTLGFIGPPPDKTRLTEELSEAVSFCDNERVDYLLAMGANPNYAGEHRNTLLIRAAACGDYRIVLSLIRAGAIINARNDSGKSALDCALANKIHCNVLFEGPYTDYDKCVEILKQNGAVWSASIWR